MPFGVAGWVAIAGAAATVYSADKASDAAADRNQTATSLGMAELDFSREQLAYYKERDAANHSLQAGANAIAGRVANSQIALMDQQRRISGEYHDRNKKVFWPLENGIVKDAKNYDTVERRESEAAKGVADVETMISGEREAARRDSMRMGVNPNSGNALAMENQMTMGAASAKAAAAGAGRDKVETIGFARRMDAASLGRNLPSAQATAASTAIQAGNGAVSAAYAPVSAHNTSTQIMGQGYQQAGNTMSGAHQLLLAGQDDGAGWGAAAAGFGQMTGTLAANLASK